MHGKTNNDIIQALRIFIVYNNPFNMDCYCLMPEMFENVVLSTKNKMN